jgi:DNA-binding beta-propeller fold protein YncE
VTGKAPYGSALFPYDNYGYTTNSGSNSVTVIDFSKINEPDNVVFATISIGKE